MQLRDRIEAAIKDARIGVYHLDPDREFTYRQMAEEYPGRGNNYVTRKIGSLKLAGKIIGVGKKKVIHNGEAIITDVYKWLEE